MECFDTVKWVTMYYEPQLARLGVEKRKPDFITTLSPLISVYRSHIRVHTSSRYQM
jgi:hypothetical protein